MSNWWHGGDPGGASTNPAKGKAAATATSVKPTGLGRYDGSMLKTAVQKMIRRNRAEDAAAIAKALLGMGQLGTIRRRLPVVIAEDCGWRKMWMAPIFQDEDTLEPDVLKLVWACCQGVHDKSCEPLMGRARVANKTQGKPDPAKFEAALKSGDLDFCSRVIVDQLDPMEKGGQALGLWVDLADEAKTKESERPGIGKVVDAARRRLGQGLYENDRSLLTIATTQAVVGKTFTNSPVEGWEGDKDWKAADVKISPRTSLVDVWWAFDLHGFLGKVVGGILNKRLGIDAAWLEWGWFCAESGLVEPAKDDEYLKDWDQQVRAKFNGETLAQMTAKWKELRPEAEGCMTWLLKQRGLI